jgi:DNA-binding MarR family transcriptional regulator
MITPQVLSQDETIGLLLERSQRPNDRVPLRESFVQQRRKDGTPRGGPLRLLARDDRGLQLFLLAHAVTSGGDFSVTEWSTTWARTVGLYDDKSAMTAVSRAWKRLEDARLIRRERGQGGKVKVTVLREDGKGRAYQHPHEKGELYFGVPFAYWTAPERWHDTLTMPAKVMLLVTLSLRQVEFPMPQDRVPEWYDISADTAMRGLGELIDRDVLEVVREDWFKTLKSKTGLASQHLYRLKPPFDLKGRGMGTARRRRRASTP